MAKRKRYTPAPQIPPELQALQQAILDVLSGRLSVSEAARQMSLSRNHFQTMMHRGLSGLTEGLKPRPSGKPPAPPRQTELEQHNQRLQQENDRLRQRVETIDRLLGVASDLLKGRQLRSRQARKRPPGLTSSGKDGDDEGEVRELLEGARALMRLGLSPGLAASVVGRTEATLRRWSSRQRRSEPLVSKRGPQGAQPLGADLEQKVRSFVRETHGLVGAEAMRHTFAEVSRRQASRLKKDELALLQKELLEQTTRITVTAAGIVRGSDAMHVRTLEGPCFLFASADASIPFRTSIEVLDRYDGLAVAAAIEKDFREHGAPLVWRCDRARAHEVPVVREVLRDAKVLLLHGPAHYPRFYGQLERQNREHRSWLRTLPLLSREQFPAEVARMRETLNARWPRATLGWVAPAEPWMLRAAIDTDRDALRDEVCERTERIRRGLDARPSTHDLPERLAIEQVLAQHGFLHREVGGWC